MANKNQTKALKNENVQQFCRVGDAAMWERLGGIEDAESWTGAFKNCFYMPVMNVEKGETAQNETKIYFPHF